MQGGIRLDNGDRLARVSAQLKAAGNKDLQKSMRKRLREAVVPVAAEVKGEAATVSKSVAQSITTSFSYSRTRAGASIIAKRQKMPEGKESLPALLEFGSRRSGGTYIRHPVFGSKTTYARQPIKPYFFRNAKRYTTDVQIALGRVLNDIERELTKGT